jgi:hypothetical protein
MRLRKMLGMAQKGVIDVDDDFDDEDEDEKERKRRQAEDEAKRNPFSAQIGARHARAQNQRRKSLMDEAEDY